MHVAAVPKLCPNELLEFSRKSGISRNSRFSPMIATVSGPLAKDGIIFLLWINRINELKLLG